jgi:hypothetical protein
MCGIEIRHFIRTEQRPANCCNRHKWWWVVCSCGIEVNVGFDDHGESTLMTMSAYVTRHEALAVIKTLLGDG